MHPSGFSSAFSLPASALDWAQLDDQLPRSYWNAGLAAYEMHFPCRLGGCYFRKTTLSSFSVCLLSASPFFSTVPLPYAKSNLAEKCKHWLRALYAKLLFGSCSSNNQPREVNSCWRLNRNLPVDSAGVVCEGRIGSSRQKNKTIRRTCAKYTLAA